MNPEQILVQAWAGPIQHGDTLLLGFRGKVTREQAARAREVFAEVMPGVTLAILDDVVQVAVYRP